MENDGQLELRAEHLTEGASDTSRHVRNVYITFLLLCTYIGVIIGSTTHEQLLRVDPVTLPILSVGLPIVGFYIFIPWLLVIFHFNLLLQFYFLSRVLRRADEAIDRIKQQNNQDEIRDTLFPFHFSHLLAGRQHGIGLRFLLTIIVWITVMLVPLLLLVWAQVQFLPYHDEMITWVQRAALMTDFTILWILWPMTMSPQGSLRSWWWHFITATPKALWAIITGLWTGILVILKRSSISQLSAKWASVRFSHHARGAMTLLISSLILIPFSVFVAVIPEKTMENWLTETEHEYKHVPESWIVDVPEGMTRQKWKHSPMLRLTYTLFEANDAPFRRNLAIVGKVLVAGSPTDATLVALQEGNPEEQERAFQEIRGLENLAGRDLRYANLSRTYLPKANLNSAQFDGADLERAQLQGASLRLAGLQKSNLNSANLQGADLEMAQLQGAHLYNTQLQEANLRLAELQESNLNSANLQGADLEMAQLQKADLSNAQLQGANLFSAKLQGARLAWAKLQGANFKQAKLQGAYIESAQLQGADLYNAELQKANLRNAQLQGANLMVAQLQGADLYLAQLQKANLNMTWLTKANLEAAQLQGVNLSGAHLQGASLHRAVLKEASLKSAKLQGANLSSAQLQGANLNYAQLDGANLKEAQLQGANLIGSQLQGANLGWAKLQGASLIGSQLQGANLFSAKLQGANLESVKFQGANLHYAKLQGADLYKAQLQGAIFKKNVDLSLAVLLELGRGQFTQGDYDKLEKVLIKENMDEKLVSKILKDTDELIGRADDLVFGPATHHALCDEVDPDSECLTLEQEEQFVKEWVEYIVSLACPDSHIAAGLARQAIQHLTRPLNSDESEIDTLRRHKASMLAKQLLSPDCKGGVGIPDDVREKLQESSRESRPYDDN